MLISNISKKHYSIYEKFKGMIQDMRYRPCHTVQFFWQLLQFYNWYVKNILANCDGNVYLPILHLPSLSKIALQVARKIAPCDRALIHVCLAYLFLRSGQVLSSFKCYFKRKYLNLIDSSSDVDESCPWFFIGTVLPFPLAFL